MAADLQNAVGVEAQLTPGSGGAFEVTVDGTLIYSKLRTGRFPTTEEILQKIQN